MVELDPAFTHSTAASATAVSAPHFDRPAPLVSPWTVPAHPPPATPLDLLGAFQHCPGCCFIWVILSYPCYPLLLPQWS